MSNIFISYSRNDLEIAEKIVSVLAESKLDTWIDWKSIPKGEKFGHEIYQGIEGATVFLFLISPNSVQSEWCQKEISHALRNKKRIIPILIKDTDGNSIPTGISERNWIHCRENRDDFNKAITEVLNTIHTDYEWVKYHTKLQVKALDWERRSNKDDTSLLIRGRELQEAEQKLASMGSQKDPQPTDLQRNFVFTSRKAEQSRRKTITGIIAGASIIFCLLCMIAIVGGGVAYIQSNLAKENELARATAQDTAFSRDLAIVAQGLDSQSYESLVLKTLLSIESLKRSPTSSLAVENIHGLSLPKKINSITSNNSENGTLHILDGIFSEGGKALAAGYTFDLNSTLQIWDVESGEVVYTWDCPNKIEYAKFSKDGKFIAVACEGDVISIFDLIDGNLNSFQYETGSIFALDVRSGAHRVFVNSTNGTDWWLNGDTGEKTEFQNSQDVSYLTLSQDGSMVAGININGNKELYVWDVNSGNLKWTISAKDKFDITAFSNSSQFLVIGGDNSISIWSLADGTLQKSFPFDTAWFINDLKISTDDTKIGVASSSGLASVIDAETGEQLWSFSGHQAESLSFSPDGLFVAVSDREGTTLVADIVGNKTAGVISYSNARPGNGLQFSQYSNRILVLEYLGAALWDLSELGVKYRKSYPADIYIDPKSELIVSVLENKISIVHLIPSSQPDYMFDIGFTPQKIAIGFESGVMAFVDNNGKIYLYSINDGNFLGEIDNMEGVKKMVISPSGYYLAIASESNIVNIFDLNTRQVLAQVRIEEVNQLSEWTGFVFSPGEKSLLVLSNKFYSLEMPSGRLLYSIHPIDLVLSNVVYSPDGNYIAFSEKNAFNNSGTTCIYDASSGEKTFCNNGYFAGSVQFSKDGNFLYQDSYDDEIFVWDVRTGEIIERFQDLSGPILLGPDANIVVYSRDPNAKTISVVMLDVVSKAEAFRITRNADYLQVLGFSDDTKRLVVLERNLLQEQNENAVITAWYWQSIDMISDGCQRVYRNLTTQEWEKYLPGEPWRITCENIQQP